MTPAPARANIRRKPPRKQDGGALLGLVVLALLGFAVFFVGFLLAPLLILLVFCLVFAARNKSGSGKKGTAGDEHADGDGGGAARGESGLEREARVRRDVLARESRRGGAARQAAAVTPPSAPSAPAAEEAGGT